MIGGEQHRPVGQRGTRAVKSSHPQTVQPAGHPVAGVGARHTKKGRVSGVPGPVQRLPVSPAVRG